MRSIKRTHSLQPATAKLLITLPLLRAVIGQIQSSSSLSPWDHQILVAAFVVSFTCFLRCSELTWDTSSLTQLLVGSITWHEDYAILLLPLSKTNPFHLSTPLMVPHVNRPECPYAALCLICPSIRHPTAPLFGLQDSYKPLTRAFFLQHLCLAISRLGLDTKQYASHLFHCGAAMWAASQGIDAEMIKLLGWWNSNCYHHYVDCSTTERRTMVAATLYSNHNGPLVPSSAAWRDPVL
ncbi:hypothetical protein [Sporisorium scitamineum]|uniref:Tyr recombinase domain-containing protein n=1 Tax=Sporisorium scitamineum TaxID=49012 RepID=A0A0F7RX30_9BASI|nr:hypothetical protein [Sporisorium scitamineum]